MKMLGFVLRVFYVPLALVVLAVFEDRARRARHAARNRCARARQGVAAGKLSARLQSWTQREALSVPIPPEWPRTGPWEDGSRLPDFVRVSIGELIRSAGIERFPLIGRQPSGARSADCPRPRPEDQPWRDARDTGLG
jgi:hypothetical protein